MVSELIQKDVVWEHITERDNFLECGSETCGTKRTPFKKRLTYKKVQNPMGKLIFIQPKRMSYAFVGAKIETPLDETELLKMKIDFGGGEMTLKLKAAIIHLGTNLKTGHYVSVMIADDGSRMYTNDKSHNLVTDVMNSNMSAAD